MDLRMLRRRTEMLDAVCTGLHPSAVIGQLAEKYSVSEKALWSDWLRYVGKVGFRFCWSWRSLAIFRGC